MSPRRPWTACARPVAWIVVTATALVLLGHARVAVGACPSEEQLESTLTTAESFYVRRKYAEVAELLAPLVDPEVCLRDEARRQEVRLLLGVAYFQQEDFGLAELEFLSLLRLDPDYEIDDLIPVPAAAAAFIEEVRLEHKDELEEIRILKGGGQGVVVETVYVTFEDQHNQFWINFLPFGAGQFQNGQDQWGWTFASLEAVAGATSVLGYVMVEVLRARTPDPGGRFTPAERERAEIWRIVQLSAGWGFVAIYAAGVTHAALNFRETKRLRMLPPSRDKPELPEDETLEFTLAPWAHGEGMGLGLTIEF